MFIDAETHRVLVIVQGASPAIGEKVMRSVSHGGDRRLRLLSGGERVGETAGADRVHLAQNLHQAANKTLKQTPGVRTCSCEPGRGGSGWYGAEESDPESPCAGESGDRGDSLLVVSGPATLTGDDREWRIRLAGLTIRQAVGRYRKQATETAVQPVTVMC